MLEVYKNLEAATMPCILSNQGSFQQEANIGAQWVMTLESDLPSSVCDLVFRRQSSALKSSSELRRGKL